MQEENENMDVFETARQAFFAGSVTSGTTVFTQAKSVDGMKAVPALEKRSAPESEEKLAVVR
jgi:hypothetical protein